MIIDEINTKVKEYKTKEKEIERINAKINNLKTKRVDYWGKIKEEYTKKLETIKRKPHIDDICWKQVEMIETNILWSKIIEATTQEELLKAFNDEQLKQSIAKTQQKFLQELGFKKTNQPIWKWKPEKQKIYNMAKIELDRYLEELNPLKEQLQVYTQEKEEIRKELLTIWGSCESVLKLYSNKVSELNTELDKSKEYALSLVPFKRNKEDAFYDPYED